MKPVALAVCGVLLGGCAHTDKPAGPTQAGNLDLRTSALQLADITDVHYTVTVSNAQGDVVWSQQLTSTQFGDGKGAIAYVGPCDASADANPNTVTLVIDELDTAAGILPTTSWHDPSPLTQTFDCFENQDVAVTINLTVMRDAMQGFFDVAVNFDDIFCSAKFDCKNGENPINLLFDPAEGDRDTTLVFAVACAAGMGQPTILYLTDITMKCDLDGNGATDSTYAINPALGPGNLGPIGADGDASPLLFETATYWGKEKFQNVDKCYWNTAIGFDLDGTPAAQRKSCTLTARGTASQKALLDNHTPANGVYPVIEWNVPVTNAQGDLVCGSNPLGAVGSGVVIGYSKFEATTFAHHYTCGETPGKVACTGMTQGLAGKNVVFQEVAGGFQVAVGGSIREAVTLPDGMSLGGCCGEPNPFGH